MISSFRAGRAAPAPTRILATVALAALLHGAASAASPPGARGEHGMVAAPERLATRVAVDVLRGGGNAIDASVALAFALSVTYPIAGCVGGGGFALLRRAEGDYRALDFREVAPRALEPDLFLDEEGRPVPSRSLAGGLAIGVPGCVAGLAEAHRSWGSRPWPELLQPAIRLADQGFPVYPWLAETLELAAEKLLADPEARRIFTRDGRALREGERLRQRDLARTLRRISRAGTAGFYEGPVAEALVRSVRRHGGVLDAADLADYRVRRRDPLIGAYRGHRIVAFPPPSSGGVALLQILGQLEGFDLHDAGAGSSLAAHLTAEAARRAFADRSRWLGDPDFYEVPLAALLDRDYLDRRAAGIRAERATPSTEILPAPAMDEGSGETLHFSVADGGGRAVAMTLTLNAWFGTGIVADGTGVLLNNEIDDFALAPGVPNLYGLLGGEANAIAGGKRPLSSMTPTIVERPGGGARPFLVLGSPGGSKIITAVLQVLLNVIDYGMPLQEAVDAPRFHHQWQPDRIDYEPAAFPRDVRVNLEARGHRLEPLARTIGNVNAIGLTAAGVWIGAADPRRQGAAEGF